MHSADVVGTDVAGEPILLHTQNWTYLDFNPIGARIWTLLEKPQTVAALVTQLMAEFAVGEADCRRDTELFLQDMLQKGFISAA
ncbi:MAG TPA: PqqD family protein [Rhizomicrobium sp.]|nr:PqqD family protein [Rhizomicrobium sp.]